MNDLGSGFFRSMLPAVWMASVLCGCDVGHSPSRVGTVRLDALVAEFSVPVEAEAVGGDIAELEWPPGLEAALATVAERRGVVLFPAGAVVIGARDYTFEVALELAGSTGRIGYLGEFGCAPPVLGGPP